MGRTIINPPPPGETCGVCWGAGLPFGPGLTPSVIVAVFSGIEKGGLWVPADGDPPNDTFRLTQDSSCGFGFLSADEEIFFEFLTGITECLFAKQNQTAFSGVIQEPCQLRVLNDNSFATSHFFDGQVDITF